MITEASKMCLCGCSSFLPPSDLHVRQKPAVPRSNVTADITQHIPVGDDNHIDDLFDAGYETTALQQGA
jgi:hypothetical protein